MVKNWMILGDDAFDSNHDPIGVIELSPEELDNWQNIAWKRLADIVNNNEKVRNLVFGSNCMYFGAVFSKCSGVTKEDVEDFADSLFQNIDDLEYYTVDFSVNPRTDDGTLILAFGMYDEKKLQKFMPTHYTYIKGDMIIPIDFRSFCFFS